MRKESACIDYISWIVGRSLMTREAEPMIPTPFPCGNLNRSRTLPNPIQVVRNLTELIQSGPRSSIARPCPRRLTV